MTAFRIGRLDVQIVDLKLGVGSTAVRMTLAGRLDDNYQLAELAAQLPPAAREIAVETSGVTFTNSIGMREWVRLMRALRDRGTKVTLEALADVLMVHMNVLSEFRGLAHIASFHAAYACSHCGFEASMKVDAVANADQLRQLRPPTLPCPECGSAMELADFPERYLSIFQ